MDNSSSSELPLAGVICLAVFGYTCLIFIIVLIRYICMRQGKCQNVECGLCGKEGAPQCSQCCISCSEACGCTAPSVNGCLDKCCPNKKLTCVDVLLCQCCLGEDNCFSKLDKIMACQIPCRRLDKNESKFFDCEDFLRNFSCYQDYVHGRSCCHYSCREFWDTCCERKACPGLCSFIDFLRDLCKRRESRKVECIEDGTEMSLQHLKVRSRGHRVNHHRARQQQSDHGNSGTDIDLRRCKNRSPRVHISQVHNDRKHSPVRVSYMSDYDDGDESDDNDEESDDFGSSV